MRAASEPVVISCVFAAAVAVWLGGVHGAGLGSIAAGGRDTAAVHAASELGSKAPAAGAGPGQGAAAGLIGRNRSRGDGRDRRIRRRLRRRCRRAAHMGQRIGHFVQIALERIDARHQTLAIRAQRAYGFGEPLGLVFSLDRSREQLRAAGPGRSRSALKARTASASRLVSFSVSAERAISCAIVGEIGRTSDGSDLETAEAIRCAPNSE